MSYPPAMLRRFTDSHYLLWLLLALPGAVAIARYLNGDTFYGEVVHLTGEFSARLLIVTMAITPLRLMFPGRAWIVWLMRRRRYFGVAAFGYAALHTAVYAIRKGALADILGEAAEPGLMAGWLSFAIFIPLAITSNSWSLRILGHWWKRTHRWVYFAAILTFAHWVLVAFDPMPGWIHLSVLGALEAYRIRKQQNAASLRT
jgi:sulfoxide reductase heme-binding subunit YedZ